MSRRRWLVGVSLLAVAASAVASCDAGAQQPDRGSVVQVAVPDTFSSFNAGTSASRSRTNLAVQALTRGSFTSYDDGPELRRHPAFGTVEVVDQEPFTVRYTVQEGVHWSDGVAVDGADLLLAWAAESGALDRCQDGGACFGAAPPVPLPRSTTAQTDDGGRSLTVTYEQPFADWEQALATPAVPAHVAGQHALGAAGPQEGKDAVVAAIRDAQAARGQAAAATDPDLVALAAFWRSGLESATMPTDASLAVSSGPYQVQEVAENRYVTLAPNPEYTWGEVPEVERIILRWEPEPLAAVQALELGEVDALSTASSRQLTAAVREVDSVQVTQSSGPALLQLALATAGSGPFAPGGHHGDADAARAVREAFLLTVPRSLIAAQLSGSLAESSWTVLPGEPGHAEVVQANGSQRYADVDLAAAGDLLARAGVMPPIRVRLAAGGVDPASGSPDAEVEPDAGPDADPAVLAGAAETIVASAVDAGFDVVLANDPGAPDAGPDGGPDAWLFLTTARSDAVQPVAERFRSTGSDNRVGYASPAVDAILDELVRATDPGPRSALLLQLEQLLWADAYGVPIVRLPLVTAVRGGIEGVAAAPFPPRLVWDVASWSTDHPTPPPPIDHPPPPPTDQPTDQPSAQPMVSTTR